MTPSPSTDPRQAVARFNVLGVGVSALRFDQARDYLLVAKDHRRLGYVCICTVHGVTEARADPAFRRILNASYLTTPDGMPLVWLGPAGTERVYGPDLLLAVCNAGLVPYVPAGAYYVLADIQKLGAKDAKAAAMKLLEEHKIASVPGTSFYKDPVGETLCRFCFAKEDDVLEEAARRLRRLA